jgi:hypothetical protein
MAQKTQFQRVEQKIDDLLKWAQISNTRAESRQAALMAELEVLAGLVNMPPPIEQATVGSFSLPIISNKDGTHSMSALALLDTQMAVDKLIFSSGGVVVGPPPGGMLSVDNSHIATASLDPDGATWTVSAVTGANGVARINYSEPTGLWVVDPMDVTVSQALPSGGTGDFDPAAAVISNHP